MWEPSACNVFKWYTKQNMVHPSSLIISLQAPDFDDQRKPQANYVQFKNESVTFITYASE